MPGDPLVPTVDGDVFPCPFWYGEEPLGNPRCASFAVIWRGVAYAELRARLRGDGPPERPCRGCPTLGSKRVSDDAFQAI